MLKYICAMVKFCNLCGSLLTPSTVSGDLVFHCICKEVLQSEPEDSLRFEEYLETSESNLKYKVFIENSPFDAAGKKVAKECPECKLPFMTMIYIGKTQTVLYTCSCGAKLTNDDLTSRK